MARDQPRQPPAHATDTGETSAGPSEKSPPRRVLEISTKRRRDVIRALADGATNRAIAEKYGCNPSSVSAFRARHGRSIAALREDAEAAADAEDGLWIASRVDRLGVLQDAVERLLEVADRCDDDALPELVRTSISALHEAAEQLGQLPSRTMVASTTVVNYRFDGVDLDAL